MKHDSAHPVLKLINDRISCGSRPLHRDDGYKLGLVIEGGGMRGVVSAGMVSALELLGVRGAFDAVYGASAGGFNGAYFVANQALHLTTAYYELLNTKKFFNYLRLFRGKPAVDMKYLMEGVMVKDMPLDWSAVLDSPIPLKLVAGSLDELVSTVFCDFRTKDQLFMALNASSKLPLVAGAPVVIDGKRYLDASMFEAIPVHTAINDNCTHILVLLTRPRGQLRKTPPLENLIIRFMLSRLGPAVVPHYLKSDDDYNYARTYIQDATENPREAPFVYSFSRPKSSNTIATAELDKGELLKGAVDGMGEVFRHLVGECVFIKAAPTPFDAQGHVWRNGLC